MKEDKGSDTQVERRQSIQSIYLAPYNDGSANGEAYRKLSLNVPNLTDLTYDAKAATAAEHAMSIREALLLYPKAVGFSMILSLVLIMEGYDNGLLANFFALPAFRKRYGDLLPDGTYQLTAAWQSGLQSGATLGEIFGLFLSGIIYEKYGYKKTMLSALVLVSGCIFVLFFAQSIIMLLFGELLCGIAWGAFQANACSYAAEVTPVNLRSYVTSYCNICWIIGQLISAGVIRGMVNWNDESQWAYRIPFAVQWAWPVPIIIGVICAPESPWWLARKGRVEDAKKSLLRLTTKNNANFDADQTVALMVHTNEVEKAISDGTTYWDCFKGTDLRRTEIVCCVWVSQVFCGIWFGGGGSYFFEQAGFPTSSAFDLNIGSSAIGFIGTVLSWFLMPRVGRRTLYVYGLAAQFTILMLIGFLAIPKTTSALSWTTGSLTFLFVFAFDTTVGPVCYSLVSEIPSSRLRVKSVVLARICYNVASILANIITPRILNPSAWNLKGKGGFIWAGFCLLSLVWSYFRLPEPKGLTYCELDILFENKASARKFRRFQAILQESGYFCAAPATGISRATG